MTAPLNILLVRLWTLETERLRTSLRAAGLSAHITRVDFPAALYAALSWGTFDVVVYDPHTAGISQELFTTVMRDRCPRTPVVELEPVASIGTRIQAVVQERRN